MSKPLIDSTQIDSPPPRPPDVEASTSARNAESDRQEADGSSDRIVLPCVHCGEPTECPSTQEPSEVFCCQGCVGAYQLIQGLGLEDFYAIREQSAIRGTARPAAENGRYEQFDSENFLGHSAPQTAADGTASATLAIQGLHCAACSWLIENAAAGEPGVLATRVKMSDHTVRFHFDPAATKLSTLARLMHRLGYELSPYDPSGQDHLVHQSRKLLVQIAIAAFLAANAMWIAVGVYAGASNVENESGYGYFLNLIGTALGLISVAGPGRTFFVGAWAAIKTRTPHMDMPVALGLLVGTVVGTYNAISGVGHVYFDSLATLVFLLLIGRWIQFRQQQRAANSVDLLMRITPRHATLIRSTKPESQSGDDAESGDFERPPTPMQVLASSLMVDDLIEVRNGETVAADAVLVGLSAEESSSSVEEAILDCSLLTGESEPVAAPIGAEISAGVLNLGPPIQLRVTAVGAQSRIGRVMQGVESASAEKIPIVMLADRIGGYFVVVVTCLAAVTFLYWLQTSLEAATSNATALLVVACPCALALATPMAIAVGLGRAARRSILIQDGSVLQALATPGRIWFDKTGTLTEGRQTVSSYYGDPGALVQAAALERGSTHPVASAIIRECKFRNLDLPSERTIDIAERNGIAGVVEGSEVTVGNEAFLRSRSLAISPKFAEQSRQWAVAGESPVFICRDKTVVAIIGLSDPVRESAASTIADLINAGWQVGMLSGDHPDIAHRVGIQVGIPAADCHGGLTPEEKLAAIRDERAAGATVVMVGDGANDAAALAAADVGIAVRGGAEVSLQAAPVFVSSGKLASITQLIQAARATHRLIRTTFVVSLAYNFITVALAMTGFISPLVAAILMPLSSISVLAVTLSSRTFEDIA